MTPRSILILHGWQGNGPDHWQTWLADRLRAAGQDVLYPRLPDCDHPCPDRWGAALHAQLDAMAGAERVVICHSLACVLWLREAPRVPRRLRADRCLLVAPPCPSAGIDELARFYPTGADREGIVGAAVRTRLVCSDNDPYCDEGAARAWGAPLALEVDLLVGAGHLNTDAGFGPWPEVEDWALGRRDSLATSGLVQSGAKNGVET